MVLPKPETFDPSLIILLSFILLLYFFMRFIWFKVDMGKWITKPKETKDETN